MRRKMKAQKDAVENAADNTALTPNEIRFIRIRHLS